MTPTTAVPSSSSGVSSPLFPGNRIQDTPNYGTLPDPTENGKIPIQRLSRGAKILEFIHSNRGLFFLALAQFFGSVMNLATRFLSTSLPGGRHFHALQILLVRMSITYICSYLWMWWNNVPHMPFGRKEVRGLLVTRGCSGFIGVFGLYYSLAYLPLPDATVITFLIPTVLSFLCSIIPSINEPFTVHEKIGGLVSLIGVILIARPTFIFDHIQQGILMILTLNGTPNVSPQQRATAVLVALVGVLGAASAYTSIRAIGHRAHPLISVSYFALVTTIASSIGIVMIPSVGGFVIPKGWFEWTVLTIIGICGFLLQFLLTKGLQLEKAGRAGSMVYIQMIWATIFEWTVWGNTISLLSLFGAIMILGGAGWVNWQKWRGGTSEGKNDKRVSIGGGSVEGHEGEQRLLDDEESGTGETATSATDGPKP